jgi:hypothetical protein
MEDWSIFIAENEVLLLPFFSFIVTNIQKKPEGYILIEVQQNEEKSVISMNTYNYNIPNPNIPKDEFLCV